MTNFAQKSTNRVHRTPIVHRFPYSFYRLIPSTYVTSVYDVND